MSTNIANKFTLRAARKSDEVLELYESKGSRTVPRRERESNLSDLVDDKEMLKLNTSQRTDICRAFCEEIEQNGYYAMTYANKNWLENYLYKDELTKEYDLWLAHYGVSSPSHSCGIWQHSDSGKINGINGNVDLNISYKNYPEIMKSMGINGFKGGANQGSSQNYFEYQVQKGDTLWDLAQKYLGAGAKYKEIKALSGLSGDTIYAGQTLKIPK